jgi:hypothetical protein
MTEEGTHVPAGMESVTAVIVGDAVNPVVVDGVEVEAGGLPRTPTILVFVLRHIGERERMLPLTEPRNQSVRNRDTVRGRTVDCH